MSQCGDVKRGQDIPGKGRYAYTKYIWHACINCEARRWVVLYQGRPKHLRCGRCVEKNLREKNGRWHGGIKTSGGYRQVRVYMDDFFYPMTSKDGYVLEHRLIMAKHLNRCLLAWEVVHHKNGIKSDNRLENLALLKADTLHNKTMNKQIKKQARQITELQTRVTLLEAENVRIEMLYQEVGIAGIITTPPG